MAPVHHLPTPPPRPPRRDHPETSSRPRLSPVRQGRRIPGPRRHPLPRHHPPRRPRRHLPATPARFGAGLLADAIRQAAAAVTVTLDDDPACMLRFGDQIDPRPIRHSDGLPGTGRKLSVEAVGNYIAKYATKALDAPGVPDHPLRSRRDLDDLRCSRHHTRMITTAWELGASTPNAASRLCKWAHMLGYGGHFLTKSRRYSVTFGQLRRARTEHRRRQRHLEGQRDPWGRPLDDTVVLVLSVWSYDAPAHTIAPAAELALAAADRARAQRLTEVAIDRPPTQLEEKAISE